MADYIILGLLMKCDLSGYDIKKSVDTTIGLFYSLSFGSIYPALKRLCAKDLIEIYEIEEQGRKKKNYRILDRGREVFMSWLESPCSIQNKNFLVKVFFYDYLQEHMILELLEGYEKEADDILQELISKKETVENNCKNNLTYDQYYYKFSTLNFGIMYFTFLNDWLHKIKIKEEFL